MKKKYKKRRFNPIPISTFLVMVCILTLTAGFSSFQQNLTICFIALTIIRIIQYKILKYENKSTLNVDGWEQGITANKLKDELNKLEADAFDENSYKMRKPTDNIIKLLNTYEYNFNFRLPSKQEIIELRNYVLKRNI